METPFTVRAEWQGRIQGLYPGHRIETNNSRHAHEIRAYSADNKMVGYFRTAHADEGELNAVGVGWVETP